MTVSPHSESTQPVDHEVLAKLEEWGGKDLRDQIIELFVETTPVRIAAARRATSGEDVDEGVRAVHSLRSSAGNVGARILSKLAENAEESLAGGGLEAARSIVDELESEFSRVHAVLRPSAAGESADPEGADMLPRIAVVEDNPDNRLLVQALIGDRYKISEYETGQEALNGIRADPPELVLLDISLPGMDGTEVLAQLRAEARFQNLPVVALTAHAMAGDREKFLSLGFDDYVTKPIIDEDVLIGAIERWLTPVR